MIDLLPSPEQRQIVDGAHALLAERAPIARLRACQTGDPTANRIWGELAEFGWFLLALPEDRGGAGASLVEEMSLLVEAGRFLLPPSVLATNLAAHLAAVAGARDLVDALASGRERAGFALPDPAGGWYLLDAAEASYVFVFGDADSRLFSRDIFAGRRPVPSLDEAVLLEHTTPASDVIPLVEAPAGALGWRAAILPAAMLVGLAEASRDLAVEYAKLREQFGQPIGAFQAVKHRCTDMAVRAEMASAQVAYAALAEIHGLPDAGFQATSAAIASVVAARDNGTACIQLHGGMGFTFECHAHRFLKRSHVLEQLSGGMRALETQLLAAPAPY